MTSLTRLCAGQPKLPALAMALSLFVFAACPSQAGPVLDDLLNYMRLDSHAPARGDSSITVTSQAPVGQSFVTGPKVDKLCRIAVSVPYSTDDWTKGESLVMTLYDSPAKKKKLAAYAMTFGQRAWEDKILCYPIWVKVRPSQEYYFELTVTGGDGSIGSLQASKGAYPQGQEYLAGRAQQADVWFELHVKDALDRDAVNERAYSTLNLDASGLQKVKAAVGRRDWETAEKELVAHFEGRADLMTPKAERKPKRDPSFDTTEADLAANQEVKDANGNIVDLRPDWNHLRWWPTRGGVGLTRGGLRKPLAAAYVATGNEKYAKAFNDMIVAYLTNLPPPTQAGTMDPNQKDQLPIRPGGLGGGTMWAGLSSGARMGHGFAYYERFMDSPNFKLDTKAAFILELPRLAEVLALQKGGGNWATQMTDALFEFGSTYPEFKRSPEYFRMGFDGMLANMRETMQEDGPIGESMGYQTLTLGRFNNLLKKAEQFGLQVPPDASKMVEKGYQFQMYTMMPDSNCPPWGDGNAGSQISTLLEGAKDFGRKDMLWVATHGAQGTPPEYTSYAFPVSGYYVMRSDWTPDARYLILKNSHYTSHGHADSTSFMMSAYGRPLIIDPGIYIYGTPEAVRLISTPSHSAVQVDHATIHNDGGPNLWQSTNGFDYIDATGPGYSGVSGVVNRRRILFVKPDYWVVSDTVTGSGRHLVESRFHLSGGEKVNLDAATEAAVTLQPGKANLMILPLGDRASASIEQGDDAIEREKLVPAPIVKYSLEADLPVRLDTVLYPLKPGQAASITATALPADTKDAACSGSRINSPAGTDMVVFGPDDGRVCAFGSGKVMCAATSAYIRKDPSGKVTGFGWTSGTSLSAGSEKLASSDKALEALSVQYRDGIVEVSASSRETSLQVSAGGAKEAVVNGKRMPLNTKEPFFRPYGS